MPLPVHSFVTFKGVTHRKGKKDMTSIELHFAVQTQERRCDARHCLLICSALNVLYSYRLAVTQCERCTRGDPSAVHVDSSACVRTADDEV